MRDQFREYFIRDHQALSALWGDATFTFDTNALLHLYRYSDDTSALFRKLIVGLKDRVWLPHQVGLEFLRNRIIVLLEQRKRYEDFGKKMSELVKELEEKYRHPFLSQELFGRIEELNNLVSKEIEGKVSAYEDSIRSDSLLEEIALIFEGKVGDPFDLDATKKLYTEGEQRYKDKVPPGYADAKKPDNERYGDWILWKQIINHAQSKKCNIIFVSDDTKEDWWLEHHGRKISPRPELLKEFTKLTGKECHFYTPVQFMQRAAEFLGESVSSANIEELESFKVRESTEEKFRHEFLLVRGTSSDVKIFQERLLNAGYNVSYEYHVGAGIHEIVIALPSSIPDLERRLYSRYVSQLESMGLELVENGSK